MRRRDLFQSLKNCLIEEIPLTTTRGRLTLSPSNRLTPRDKLQQLQNSLTMERCSSRTKTSTARCFKRPCARAVVTFPGNHATRTRRLQPFDYI